MSWSRSGQIRSTNANVECRATHVLWVNWDAEIDGDIHFQVWPEERSMLGQTRSQKVKFSNSKFAYKTCLSCPAFFSGFQKCYLFLRTTIINAKTSISKK